MDQAENLRNLIKKNNIPARNARVITVTSGKGGVGKTSVSVNMAIQLQRLGKKVIVIDADFGLANVEILLGIRPKYNLADLIYHDKSIQEIITKGPENIGFISGGSGIKELVNLDKDKIAMLIQKLYVLDELADIIIIDTGAGITDSVLEFVSASSEVFLVITPEPTSLTDAYALLKTLDQRKGELSEETVIKVITNRVESFKEGRDLFHKLSMVVNRYLGIQVRFLGGIPQDKNVLKAVMQQKPVSVLFPSAMSSRAIMELAEMINENKMQEQQERKGIIPLFSNLLKGKSKA